MHNRPGPDVVEGVSLISASPPQGGGDDADRTQQHQKQAHLSHQAVSRTDVLEVDDDVPRAGAGGGLLARWRIAVWRRCPVSDQHRCKGVTLQRSRKQLGRAQRATFRRVLPPLEPIERMILPPARCRFTSVRPDDKSPRAFLVRFG